MFQLPVFVSKMPAQITFKPLWTDSGIPLAMMGMFVVFAALILVASFIAVLPKLMAVLDRWHPEPQTHATKKKAKPKAKPQSDSKLSDELLVVIAAAVAEVIDEPHRIIHMRPLRPEEHNWSLGGRMQQHTSHGLQQRKP